MQKQSIEALAEDILRHKRLYYLGSPEISDAEFDDLEQKLRAHAPEHIVLQKVGYQPSANKVVHDTPMLSLDKTYDTEELINWAQKSAQGSFPTVIATWKIDGNSLSLVYKDGVLVQAKTRGSGTEGEDVLDKIHWIPSCPKSLAHGNGEIRGEVVCHQKSFEDLKHDMLNLKLEAPSNPRNIVAGVLGRKKHEELARFFHFYAFDAIIDDAPFETENDKMTWLKDQGFLLPEYECLTTPGELEHKIENSKTGALSLDMAVDGVVITLNDLHLHDELGHTSHHPRYKMSFKWQGDTAVSQIQHIHWATSPYGVVTPVAVIEPTPLSGATISNVTLHNADLVQTRNLGPGDHIEIIRSGEVIPKFLNTQHTHPSQCQECGETLVWSDGDLLCPQHETEKSTLKSAHQSFDELKHWIRKRPITVRELSETKDSTRQRPMTSTRALREFCTHSEAFDICVTLTKQNEESIFRNRKFFQKTTVQSAQWEQHGGRIQHMIATPLGSFAMPSTKQAYQHNLHTGDTIWIDKVDEHLVFVDKEQAQALPKTCPSCEEKLQWDDDEVRLLCTNNQCPAQIKGHILKWIRSVDIDDISEKRIQDMLDHFVITSTPDLYRLTHEKLLTLPLVGDKLANKLLGHIENSKTVPLTKFLCGLGIPGTGITSWEKLTVSFPSLENLCNASIDDICQIDGFSEITATQIVNGLQQKQALIQELFAVGVTIEPLQPTTPTGQQAFLGLKIAITGTMTRPRKELTNLIKAAGGEVASAISQKTHALVIADTQSTSSKAKKARELGVELWSEDELIRRSTDL